MVIDCEWKDRNAPSFGAKNVEKEHACPFTEMGNIDIGADLVEGREEKLTFGSAKTFSCLLDILMGILSRQIAYVTINKKMKYFKLRY